MRRIIFYGIPVIAFILFIIIMNGGIYLKNVVGKDGHFIDYYEDIRTSIKEEEWEKAMNKFEKLEELWRAKISLIQFSVERDQINGIDISFARLKGYLESKNKAGSLAELYEAKRHWEDLGR
ncbi:MAG: DUF4363 family protein [Tepidanaerobacteraceae bacterium]|jgi:hypothetical protein|nr:DUF4363 family protein [Thermoanaerobacterales bacterium]